jgi:prophage regulatory protein
MSLQRILRRPEVEAATGLSTTTIYERMALGTFPRPVPLGSNSVGWLETEIVSWQRARIDEREQACAAASAIPLESASQWSVPKRSPAFGPDVRMRRPKQR